MKNTTVLELLYLRSCQKVRFFFKLNYTEGKSLSDYGLAIYQKSSVSQSNDMGLLGCSYFLFISLWSFVAWYRNGGECLLRDSYPREWDTAEHA